MLNSLKEQLGFTNRSVKVSYKGGRMEYGVIIDFIDEPFNLSVNDWKFVPNGLLKNYEETENPGLIKMLRDDLIESIDVCLK